MRSLYVDDIPGAKPVKRVYDKSMKRAKLDEQIHRFAKNPEKHVIDWHVLERNVKEPLDKKDDGRWRIKKTLDSSFNELPKSMVQSAVLQRALSHRDFDQKKSERSSSVLTDSARNSLRKSSIYDDPYFPHRMRDQVMGENNKWSGTRGWQDIPSQSVKLPSIKREYIGKWN